jgi:mannose-6-phosphate isomerase
MRPLLFSKIWGGHKLAHVLGKGAADVKRCGESWEVADLIEGTTLVAAGPLEGRSLAGLVREHGAALVGRAPVEGGFPLLVKIIDAGDDLSVQVHPGPQTAARFPGARSKDECWLVLDVEPGARLLHGFVDGVTAERFDKAVAEGRAHELLRSVEVAAGDVVRVAPGTFHAIGKGVLLLEVQEPSDTTFRVWDYGRLGDDGQPRELHVERALAVAHYGEQPPVVEESTCLGEGHDLLVDAAAYRLERLALPPGGSLHVRLGGETPLVVFLLEGDGATLTNAAGSATLSRWASAVIPASSGSLTLSASSTGGAVLALAGRGGAPLLS